MFGRSKDMKEVLGLMRSMVKKMPTSDPEMARTMVDNYIAAFNNGREIGFEMGRAAERSALIENAETRVKIRTRPSLEEPPPPSGYNDLHPGEVSIGMGKVGAPA